MAYALHAAALLLAIVGLGPTNVHAAIAPAFEQCPAGQVNILYREAERAPTNSGFVCGVPTSDCERRTGYYECPARPGHAPRPCPFGQILIEGRGCGAYVSGCYQKDPPNGLTYICPNLGTPTVPERKSPAPPVLGPALQPLWKCASGQEPIQYLEDPPTRRLCGVPTRACVRTGAPSSRYHFICPARLGRESQGCPSRQYLRLMPAVDSPLFTCGPLVAGCEPVDPPRNTLYDCRSKGELEPVQPSYAPMAPPSPPVAPLTLPETERPRAPFFSWLLWLLRSLLSGT